MPEQWNTSERPLCNSPSSFAIFSGASLGGPAKKDRLYFMNFEGTRRAVQVSEIRQVPSASLRDGVIFYQCDTTDPNLATDCPGGSQFAAVGKSGTTYTPQPGYVALGQTQLAKFDPQSLGTNSVALAYMNSPPPPNTLSVGDGFNYQGFNSAAPISDTQNVYIAKMDFNLTRDAKHRISVSGALRNDDPQAPFFPGEAPAHSFVNYSKGIIVNYSGVLKQSLVNSFRYAFVRESLGDIGNSNQQWVFLRGINDQTDAITRTQSFQRPTNTFADDISWIHGHHTWQFGGVASFIRNPRISFNSSFSDASANSGWTSTSGFAGKNSPLNPGQNTNPNTGNPYPGVDSSFFNSYDFPLTALMGMVTEAFAQYNFARDGSALPQGTALKRHFAINSCALTPKMSGKLNQRLHLHSVCAIPSSLRHRKAMGFRLLRPSIWEIGFKTAPWKGRTAFPPIRISQCL